jgi:hypothetical protein
MIHAHVNVKNEITKATWRSLYMSFWLRHVLWPEQLEFISLLINKYMKFVRSEIFSLTCRNACIGPSWYVSHPGWLHETRTHRGCKSCLSSKYYIHDRGRMIHSRVWTCPVTTRFTDVYCRFYRLIVSGIRAFPYIICQNTADLYSCRSDSTFTGCVLRKNS